MNSTTSFIKYTSLLLAGTLALLLIPFTAMNFSGEVNWSASDFLFAGGLLFGSGMVFRLISLKSENLSYKAATGIAVFSGLFLIWTNLAVGLVGSEGNAFNLVYFGVLALGLMGAAISNFKAKGMMLSMFAMAGAQALTVVIALIIGMQNQPENSVLEIFGVNALFIFLYVIAALLFKNASLSEQWVAGTDED